MLALKLTEAKRLEVLPVEEQGPLEDGQLLVRMEYSGVQPLDSAIFNGESGLELPRVLGNEGVGVVECSESEAFSVGTRVAFMLTRHMEDSGSWQSAVRISKDRACIASVPTDLAPQLAAAGITSTIVALACLRHFTRGALLVVSGACGAVGNTLLQLAALRGMRVLALVRGSERVACIAREFGESGLVVAVDITAPGWIDLALVQCENQDHDGAHGVIDGIGGDALIQVAESLIRPHGFVVTYGALAGASDKDQLASVAERHGLRRIAESASSILLRRDASKHLQDGLTQMAARKYEPRVWQEVHWRNAAQCLIPQPGWSEFYGASQFTSGRLGRILLRFDEN